MNQLNENPWEYENLEGKICVFEGKKCKVIEDDRRGLLLVVLQQDGKYNSRPQLVTERDVISLKSRKQKKS